jgi:hypothetical protein
MRINEAISARPVIAIIFAESSGRLGAMTAAAAGLIGLVIGGRALARSRGRTGPDNAVGATGARSGANMAMVLGLIGTVLGALFVATADGGFGTGNGLAGAIVAIVLGLIAIVLGVLARARRREVA